jgi:pyruvate/2-oxoglutarate dehydrogenase complex dihydrolipoamide acyltransferase (E2) component
LAASQENGGTNMSEKDLGITEVRGAHANIKDLVIYGDGDTFALLCKASSQDQGWMKSTKVCNLPDGCIVQVTTQQKNPDGSYAVAEALTYVPGVNMDKEANPRRLEVIVPF